MKWLRRPFLPLLLPVVIGGSLRAAWFVLNLHTICWDEVYYHDQAVKILSGQPYGLPFLTPGWVLVTALFYQVFGVHARLAFLLNGFFTTLMIPAVGLLAHSLYNNRRTALVAMWILALMPSYILAGGLHLYLPLLQLLLIVSIWLGLRPRWSWWSALLIGLMAGLAALMRPFWGILPALLFFGCLALRRAHPRWGQVLLAQGLALVVLFGWVAYISLENGRFIPVSLNSTLNFWMANNPDASGTHVQPPSEYFLPENEPEVRAEAMGYFRQHPWKMVELIPAKLYFMYYREALLNWVFASTRLPVSRAVVDGITFLGDLFYWIILAGSSVMVAVAAAQKKYANLTLLGVVIYNTLSYIPFTGQLLYRWPTQFVLVIYTALLVDLGRSFFTRQRPEQRVSQIAS